MVNVFNFGPALVIDGVKQDMPENYKYNITARSRAAPSVRWELEYLLVVVTAATRAAARLHGGNPGAVHV